MFEDCQKTDELNDPLLVVRGDKIVKEAKVERALIPHLDDDCRGDPLLERQRDGKLRLIFQSTGATLKNTPNCGSFRMLTSLDEGHTWSEEQVCPGPLSGQADVTGFGVLPDDSLLLNWSTLAPADSWRGDRLGRARGTGGWNEAERGSLEGFFHAMYVARSTDGGRTWSEPVELDSRPFDMAGGLTRPLVLRDGTTLLSQGLRFGSGYDSVPDCQPLPPARMGIRGVIYRSADGGRTWGDRTLMLNNGCEARLVELESGRLLAAVRCQLMDAGLLGSVWDEARKEWTDPYDLRVPDDQGHKHLWVAESNDRGQTWERPRLVTGDRADCPGEPLLLPDGRILLVYCRRARPDPGVGAIVSRDGGRTWDEEQIILKLNRDTENGTYPSSSLLADGTVVTVTGKNHGNRVQAIHWQVPEYRSN